MLVLVRHGESVWNAADRFAGSIDVALTETGRAEARAAGIWLREHGITPSVAHTSLLARARNTAALALDACGCPGVPVLATARLNERHYGALQGMTRTHAVTAFGAEQVARWRRGLDDRPPADRRGRAESLADVGRRLVPYIQNDLLPALDAGGVVLVVSHGNALRMLVRKLEGLTEAETGSLEVPTGAPRVYAEFAGLRRAE